MITEELQDAIDRALPDLGGESIKEVVLAKYSDPLAAANSLSQALNGLIGLIERPQEYAQRNQWPAQEAPALVAGFRRASLADVKLLLDIVRGHIVAGNFLVWM